MSARFGSAFSLSSLSSSRSTAGASWNTYDTGPQVLSAFSNPSQATVTTNSSPLAAHLIAEMLRM